MVMSYGTKAGRMNGARRRGFPSYLMRSVDYLSGWLPNMPGVYEKGLH